MNGFMLKVSVERHEVQFLNLEVEGLAKEHGTTAETYRPMLRDLITPRYTNQHVSSSLRDRVVTAASARQKESAC